MKSIVILALFSFSTPVLADDALVLFPKGREAYQAKFESNTEMYEVNRRTYVDNLYEFGGEGGPATKTEPMLPEATLDSYIDGTTKLNVDTTATPAPMPPQPAAKTSP